MEEPISRVPKLHVNDEGALEPAAQTYATLQPAQTGRRNGIPLRLLVRILVTRISLWTLYLGECRSNDPCGSIACLSKTKEEACLSAGQTSEVSDRNDGLYTTRCFGCSSTSTYAEHLVEVQSDTEVCKLDVSST